MALVDGWVRRVTGLVGCTVVSLSLFPWVALFIFFAPFEKKSGEILVRKEKNPNTDHAPPPHTHTKKGLVLPDVGFKP